MRRHFGALLMMLLAWSLMLALGSKPARGSGTIYIRSDGSVDPPTAPIHRVGDLYTLTADIYESIVVEKNNIVVDGAGYAVQGLGSGNGIDLAYRSNVTIKNAEIRAFGNGIFCWFSTDIKIFGNRMTENSNGIEFWSVNIGMNVSGNTFTENTQGVEMMDTYESTVSHNTIANNSKGILLRTVSSSTISMNDIINNTMGIDLENSGYTSVSGNNVTANSCGIELDTSNNLNIAENEIAGSDKGIVVAVSSYLNVISENSIAHNNYGIEVTILTGNNIIIGNNITENTCGLWLLGGNSNRFYHNNFVGNAEHVEAALGLGYNLWDNSYPSGGNYWSGYADVDEFKGPNQDEIGSDGIWDHPYVIATSNVDRYPFTQENGWELPPPPPPPPLPEFPGGAVLAVVFIPTILYLYWKKKQRTPH